MKGSHKVFFVTTEITPFARTVNLADVSGSLPKVLKNSGHDIRVMMPNYKSVNERKYVLRDVIRLKDMPIQLGEKEELVSAKSGFLPDSKVQVYFLDNKSCFGRSGIYNDPANGKPFADNATRFALFAQGCLQTLRTLHWQPDVIHCNGWQTGFIPLIIRKVLQEDDFFANTRLVFSTHFTQGYGAYAQSALSDCGIPAEYLQADEHLLAGDSFSLLKAAIANSDAVTVPSDLFLQEKVEDGAEETFADLISGPVIIQNGVDYDTWDPETDKNLSENYTPAEPDAKEANKKALQEKVGLPVNEAAPLLRLNLKGNWQQETPWLPDALQTLAGANLQVLILGLASGRSEEISGLPNSHPGKIVCVPRPDTELEHLAVAGADLNLLATAAPGEGIIEQYCGLKYGAVPVLHAAVAAATANNGTDNSDAGFVFEDGSAKALTGAVQDAVAAFQDRKKWQKVLRAAMGKELALGETGDHYTALYGKVLEQD